MYADPKTYSGPDEDPMFDANDELVFMARHLGVKANPELNWPKNVLKESLVELVIGVLYERLVRKRAPLVKYQSQSEVINVML